MHNAYSIESGLKDTRYTIHTRTRSVVYNFRLTVRYGTYYENHVLLHVTGTYELRTVLYYYCTT